jgi:hypothetical protein
LKDLQSAETQMVTKASSNAALRQGFEEADEEGRAPDPHLAAAASKIRTKNFFMQPSP